MVRRNNKLPVVGVENPKEVYNKKNRHIGYSVTVKYRFENYFSYANDSERERLGKVNEAAEKLRSIASQGYVLTGEPKYVPFPKGLQVIAHFTRERKFKNNLFLNSYKRAQRFASKMREIVLHPGRHDD